MTPNPSAAVVVGAIVALASLGLAAIVLVGGDESAATARLALLFAILGPTIAALVAAVRADQAASKITNGDLEDTIQAGVLRANQARRQRDAVADPAGDELRGES